MKRLGTSFGSDEPQHDIAIATTNKSYKHKITKGMDA
jgi:hypothetical protein